jgi:DNA-binding NarL/FixJ family response regulator
VESVREQLGGEAFAEAWERGLARTPEQVLAEQKQDITVAFTSSMPQSTISTQLIPLYPSGLTKREVEVLCLVALGWSDAQVAQQLVISPRTVNGHLRSIYTKINVKSRSAATYYAMEHHLLDTNLLSPDKTT